MKVEIWDGRTLSEPQAVAIAKLLVRIWPKDDKNVETRTAALLRRGAEYEGPDAEGPRSFVVLDGEAVIAHAAMVPRTIGTSVGDMTVGGLAQVCSAPETRGSGLGAEVVRAAFAMVDHGNFRVSLFQTSHAVRAFYEKLGACLVENTIVNSLGDPPSANPFWDDIAMRYPAAAEWPGGEIDLRGPGY
ncbi:MAG: GNAT family N-acetyltransferase [Planctomycetota bacterium]